MTAKDEALKLAAEFDKRFTSMNGIDVPERVSVPRDEWRALHDAVKQALAAPAPLNPVTVYEPPTPENLVMRLKHPEDYYDFDSARRVDEVLMSLCQEAADALATPPAAPVQEPRKISDFPELQAAVRKGLADGSLIIQGASPVQEWMKPHPKCDEACLFQCTKGFAQFPECSATPPTDEIQRLAALVRAQQITIGKLEAMLKEKNT